MLLSPFLSWLLDTKLILSRLSTSSADLLRLLRDHGSATTKFRSHFRQSAASGNKALPDRGEALLNGPPIHAFPPIPRFTMMLEERLFYSLTDGDLVWLANHVTIDTWLVASTTFQAVHVKAPVAHDAWLEPSTAKLRVTRNALSRYMNKLAYY